MIEDRDREIETNQETHPGREGEHALPILSTAVGATVGGIATSSAAIGVAGASAAGVSGYATGVALTIGALECSAAAVGTLAAIAVGPIVGGVLGYVGYRVYRSRKRARAEQA
jgi:hypothetical protein